MKISRIIQAACVIVFVGCLIILFQYYMKQHQAQEVYDQAPVAESAEPMESAEPEESADPVDPNIVDQVDFEYWWDINEDVIAYVEVPGTDVSYPVLQHEDDDEYYLDYTIDGVKGYPGSIYTETWQSSDFSDPVTILYGHNMKNGTMFATLHNFEDQEAFDANEGINIYLPYEDPDTGEMRNYLYHYNIYCCAVYSNLYIPTEYDLNTWDGRLELMDGLDTGDSRNHFDESVQIDEDDTLIVLSTCIGNANYRWVTLGVLEDNALTQ